MRDIVEVHNICKYFLPALTFSNLLKFDFLRTPRILALDNISFSLPAGRILGVLGTNGAGKTTLLKLLSTLLLPDKGTAFVNNCLTGRDDMKIKSAIGLSASSERSFYWRLTGRQNLEFFGALLGLDTRKVAARIRKLFDLFEVNYGDRRFDSYSRGMQQKFSLMRAMLHETMLLLLDEPTQHLDYRASLQLRHFIKERLVHTQKNTVIFATHRLDEAVDFADLFLILHIGKLCAFGTQETLRKKVGLPEASLSEIFVTLTQETSYV